jgi:hypothetical protein
MGWPLVKRFHEEPNKLKDPEQRRMRDNLPLPPSRNVWASSKQVPF